MTIGLKRDNKEQYYTKPEVAENCVAIVRNLYHLDSFECVVEPSAGSGVFVEKLLNFTANEIISFDIEPKADYIAEGNFLLQNIKPGNILVIGNPPFGRQSSLAKKFIKHSCSFAKVIAFILPKSFKKPSMDKCFDLQFHKVFDKDLENNSFMYENAEYSVPCVFQVWEKRDTLREVILKVFENDNYAVVGKENSPDFAFRRVGGKAGTFTFSDLETLSKQSNYFIKTSTATTTEMIDKLSKITWESNNTVGPKSVSKQELIKNLNEIL
jgi:predicted RNA methylase